METLHGMEGDTYKYPACYTNQKKKSVTFTYYSPATTKVTNALKKADLQIACTAQNAILKLLNMQQQHQENYVVRSSSKVS